jgi:hypothetical protein
MMKLKVGVIIVIGYIVERVYPHLLF